MVETVGTWEGALELRPASEADEALLRELFASHLERELAYLEPADRPSFLELQWRARQRDYRHRYPNSEDQIVMAGGVAAGRLLTASAAQELVIVDLALLPDFRGRGIGSALLRRLLAQAAREMMVVHLYVTQMNPAIRLYRRLGFRQVTQCHPYVLMEWRHST